MILSFRDLYEMRSSMLSAALETAVSGETAVDVLTRAELYMTYVLQPLIHPEAVAAQPNAMGGEKRLETVH